MLSLLSFPFPFAPAALPPVHHMVENTQDDHVHEAEPETGYQFRAPAQQEN
jgi:hypothetical protein